MASGAFVFRDDTEFLKRTFNVAYISTPVVGYLDKDEPEILTSESNGVYSFQDFLNIASGSLDFAEEIYFKLKGGIPEMVRDSLLEVATNYD